MAMRESSPDLYANCQHHWHATGVRLSAHFDSGDDRRAEEVCCHCGVHRFVRLGIDLKHPCGAYAPESDATLGLDMLKALGLTVLADASVPEGMAILADAAGRTIARIDGAPANGLYIRVPKEAANGK